MTRAPSNASQLSAVLIKINEILMSELTWAGVMGRLVGEVSEAAGANKCLVIEVHGAEFTISHVHNVRDDLVGEPKDASFYPGFALAARSREPVLIEDCWNDPRTNKDFVVPYDLRAFQLIPLIVDDEVTGVLAFAYDAPRTFDDDDREFSERMATAMSLALRNARRYEAESVLAHSSSVLAGASAIMAAATDVDEVIPRVLAMAGELLGSCAAHVVVREAGGWRVRHHYGPSSAEVGQVFSDAESPSAMRLLETREPQVIPDVSVAQNVNPGVAEQLGYRSALVYPLVRRDEVAGVVSFLFEQPRDAFPDWELDFVSRLAYIISTAEENARLFDVERSLRAAEEERRSYAEALNSINAIVHSTFDPDELLRRVTVAAGQSLNFSGAAIMVREDGAWAFRNWIGIDDEVSGLRVPEEQAPLLKQIADTHEMVVLDDAFNDPRANNENYRRFNVKGAIIAPLMGRGSADAVLFMGLAHDRDRFTEAQADFARKVASTISLGIANARLYDAERERLARMQTLHELTDLAVSSLETAEVARRAFAFMTDRLDVTYVNSFIHDPTTDRLEFLAGVGGTPAFYEQVSRGFDLDSPFEVASVFATGKPAVHETVPTEGPGSLAADLFGRSDMPLGAYAVLPLASRTGTIGVVTLAWTEERSLGEADLDFYTSVANELATALSNARLYETERESLVRTTLLKEIAAAAASSIDETELSTRVIESASRLMEAFAGVIFKVDAEAGIVRSIAAFGPEGIVDRLRERPLDNENYMARTVLGGQILTHENDAPSEAGRVRAEGSGPLDMGRISVPVRMAGKVQAGFALLFPEQRHFSEEDFGFFASIADQLGTALERAELFQAEKNARASAEISEGKARSLIEFAPTAIYEIDYHGRRFLSVNEVVLEWTGYSREELLSMNPLDLLDDAGRERFQERIERKLAGEDVVGSTELGLRMKDGRERDILLTLGQLTYQDGEPVSMFVVAHDITERKAAEEAVRRQAAIEEGINRILHAALVSRSDEELGAVCLDVSVQATGSKFGFINEVGEDGLLHDVSMSNPGWEACAIQDKSGHRRLPGSFEVHGLYGRVVLDGETLVTNAPAVHPDSIGTPEGHPPLTAFLGVPLLSEGRPFGLIGVANRDGGYTQEHVRALEALARVVVEAFERMRAERELAATTQRLDAHINNSPLAVIEFDSEFRVTRWSEEAERMFGWRPDEIVGKAIGEMHWVYEEDVSLVDQESENLASSATPRSVNVNRNYRKDGSVIWCEWYDSAIYDADGHMVSTLSLVLDITERKHALAELEAERTRLREIIEDIPVGVALVDQDGSVLEINAATDRVWAGDLPKATSVEGYRVYEGYHRDTRAPVQPQEWPAPRSLATGERVEETVDIIRLDGKPATIRVDAIPIKDADGNVARVVVITEDVTERLQAERLNEAVNAIGISANSTFDVNEILHRILVEASEVLGSETSSSVLRAGDAWIVRETIGPELAEPGEVFAGEQFTIDPSIVEEGRPIVIQDVAGNGRLNEETLTGLGIRSLMVVPIVSRGEVIAVLAFHHQQRAVPFTAPEIEFATELMSVATLALDNAALYERERRIADTLQEAMLAPPEPLLDLDLAYLYRPASSAANVGGDFYDVFAIDADLIGILIGDVSGKGLEAARHTSLIRSGARAYAFEDPEPASVLLNLNTLVQRSTPLETFATVFFGVLDRHSGVLRYCGGGHPAGLVCRSDGVEVLKSRPPIVGVFSEAGFEADEIKLARGDLLVLYTDGLLEARGGDELYSEQRAIEAVGRLRSTPLAEMPQRLLDEVLAFSGGELRDDIVILCIGRGEVDPS